MTDGMDQSKLQHNIGGEVLMISQFTYSLPKPELGIHGKHNHYG
jgi:hypothetical protein